MSEKLNLITEKIKFKDCQVDMKSSHKSDYIRAIHNYLNLIPNYIPQLEVLQAFNTTLRNFAQKNDLIVLKWHCFSPSDSQLDWGVRLGVVYDKNSKEKKLAILNSFECKFVTKYYSVSTLRKIYSILVYAIEYQHIYLKIKKNPQTIVDSLNNTNVFLKKGDKRFEKITNIIFDKHNNRLDYKLEKIYYTYCTHKWSIEKLNPTCNNVYPPVKLAQFVSDLVNYEQFTKEGIKKAMEEQANQIIKEISDNCDRIYTSIE